jgi:hypothetical protein
MTTIFGRFSSFVLFAVGGRNRTTTSTTVTGALVHNNGWVNRHLLPVVRQCSVTTNSKTFDTNRRRRSGSSTRLRLRATTTENSIQYSLQKQRIIVIIIIIIIIIAIDIDVIDDRTHRLYFQMYIRIFLHQLHVSEQILSFMD